MKKIIFSFLILVMLNLFVTAQTNRKNKKGELPAAISQMTEADSLELLNNPVIKTRLKKLLGKKNYDSFLESFETVAPVEKKGVFLFASGCLIHACTQVESAIAIDLAGKTIHAAIYRRGEKTEFFNEHASATPEVIKNWAERLAVYEE